MSSTRKKLKEGRLLPGDIKFFKRNKGTVPLCCSEFILIDERTGKPYPEPLCICDQLEVPLPLPKFTDFCLKCQTYIAEHINEEKVE